MSPSHPSSGQSFGEFIQIVEAGQLSATRSNIFADIYRTPAPYVPIPEQHTPSPQPVPQKPSANDTGEFGPELSTIYDILKDGDSRPAPSESWRVKLGAMATATAAIPASIATGAFATYSAIKHNLIPNGSFPIDNHAKALFANIMDSGLSEVMKVHPIAAITVASGIGLTTLIDRIIHQKNNHR